MSLFEELKRRNVVRVGLAYIVVAWLILQVTDVVLNNVGAPDWVFRVILLVLAIGLPLVLLFAWAFELTPEGLKREHEVDRSQSITNQTARKLDLITIGVLVLAMAYFVYDNFVLSPARQAALVDAASHSAAPDSPPAPAPAASDRSIAVLPFVNMSSDAEQEYFSDGLSEELLNLLAKVPELRVIARTSSFAYKGKDVTIADVARELHVGHVLEGSVRKAGNKVRITAQLIRASDSSHLWSATFDRTLDNIFAIQDEIADAVVAELKVTLLGDRPAPAATDPEAYALFLQARHLGRQNSNESVQRSIALYQQVLDIDPNYVAAWDGLAANYAQQAAVSITPSGTKLVLAEQAAKRALSIDPNFAPAYANLANIILTGNQDLAESARHLQHAVDLDPNDPEILRNAATLYRSLGRLERAIEICERMIEVDPVNNNSYYTLAVMHRYSRNYEQAAEGFRTALSLSPERTAAWYGISEALMLSGDLEGALDAIEQEQSVWADIGRPMVLHALGRKDEADAALEKLIAEQEEGAAYNIAYVYAYRGEVDLAFEWLHKAAGYNDPGLADLPIETLFDPLRDDPRWLPFLESRNRAPQQLDAIRFDVKLGSE